MTNPTGTQWETALLNKLTNNGERIAVVEKEEQKKADAEAKINALESRLQEL